MEDHRIDPEIERVMVALALGQRRVAFILLRGLLRKSQQKEGHGTRCPYEAEIAQLKEEFQRASGGMPAYPSDFSQDDREYWDEMMGHLVECAGIEPFLEDIRANAKGKWNLLYFLSAAKGKRSSRWEMLVIRKNEEQREREKQEYQAGAKMVMQRLGEILQGKEPLKRIEPEWVMKMKKERDELIGKLTMTDHGNRDKREIMERLKLVQTQIGRWERGEL